MKLIIASNNAHKVTEIKAILGDYYEQILSLKDAGVEIDVEEDADTFVEVEFDSLDCVLGRDLRNFSVDGLLLGLRRSGRGGRSVLLGRSLRLSGSLYLSRRRSRDVY